MKKTVKVLAGVACLAAISGASLGLTACGDTEKTYLGEYKYENPYSAGSYYGVKVAVSVKDNAITNLQIVESDYTQLSPAYEAAGWTDARRQVYLDGEADLLKSYVGLKVNDVKGYEVAVKKGGEPYVTSDTDYFKAYNSDILLTGATQSSGRLLLAVQNALTEGTEVKLGEYKYENPYSAGSYYGVKVAVEVKDNKIANVYIVKSDYTQLSPAYEAAGWTDARRQVYLDGEADLLKSYVGLDVATVKGYTVAVNKVGEPYTTSDTDNFKQYDSKILLTGATQSSGRLLLAVQAALNS
jgi:hypothetical protein